MGEYSFKNLSKKNKRFVGVAAGVFLLLIIVIIILMVYQRHLYRLETVEVSNYPSALPSDMRENLEMQLRRLLALNFNAPGDALISAKIRNDAYTIDENEIVTASFLVDIDDYKQTYSVIMNWSDTVEVSDGILISCPEKSLMKYPEADCIAMYDDSQDLKEIEENPLYNSLPIIVDDFDFVDRKGIHYEIRGYFNDESELVVVINDYSGGNYENGLKKIEELGDGSEKYKIEYINRAGNF